MSLTLNSLRTVAHASIVGRAPALPTRAWKLSQTAFRPPGRNTFSTVTQRQAPEAARVPQNLETHRERQQWRIRQKRAQLGCQPGRQQKPSNDHASTREAEQSGPLAVARTISKALDMFSGFCIAQWIATFFPSPKAKSSSDTNSPQGEKSSSEVKPGEEPFEESNDLC